MTSTMFEIFDSDVGNEVKTLALASGEEGNTFLDPKTSETLYEMSLNSNNNYTQIFEYLLSQICFITKSEVGGICELFKKDIEDEYLKFVCFSNTLTEHSRNKKFHSIELDNLLGRAVNSNVIVISNNVQNDPRSKGIPTNHFKINRFLGIPLISRSGSHIELSRSSSSLTGNVIGQIVLANKTEKYTQDDVKNVLSLVKICTDTLSNIHYKKKYSIDDILQTKSEVKKTKDDFLATMSHEIRTPLTGIMGAINLLPQAGTLNEKQLKHIKIANTCSVQLLDLINGILDFSRLTSNTLTLSREPFSLRECIESSLTILRPKADMKELTLDIQIDEDLPASVIGDPKRLKQIIINILSNAIKFTEVGVVKFKCIAKKHTTFSRRLGASKIGESVGTTGTIVATGASLPSEDLYWKVKFIVTDSGVGMESENYSKIFKAFSQLPGSNAYSKQDGVGLGLAISKQLVELMGGKIKVSSPGIGQGTTFEFYINVEENINIDELLSRYHQHMNEITILNVDDKMDNLLILDEMLYRWKINSIMCNTAEQALRYLERGKKFDIVIIDIFMPHMSGIELAQRLREKYPNIPLIGISSVGEIPQGKDWFDVYLHKPYNPPKILKSIINCLSKSSITSIPNLRGTTQSSKLPKKENLKIIVAEDEPSSQFMINEMIITLGYNPENIKTVDNGKLCVDEIKSKLNTIYKYDVCLMDIKMPVMDGLEASKHIRTMEGRPSLIAISAGVLDSDKNSCLKAGMDGYLGKPFSTKELDTVLKRFVCE